MSANRLICEICGWSRAEAHSTAPDDITQVPGHYGWDGGFGSTFLVDPNRNVISIIMTQSTDFLFNGTRDQFWREVYSATSS